MEGELGAVPAMAFASWWYATVNTREVNRTGIAAGLGDRAFEVVLRECQPLILSDWKPSLVFAESLPVRFYTRG